MHTSCLDGFQFEGTYTYIVLVHMQLMAQHLWIKDWGLSSLLDPKFVTSSWIWIFAVIILLFDFIWKWKLLLLFTNPLTTDWSSSYGISCSIFCSGTMNNAGKIPKIHCPGQDHSILYELVFDMYSMLVLMVANKEHLGRISLYCIVSPAGIIFLQWVSSSSACAYIASNLSEHEKVAKSVQVTDLEPFLSWPSKLSVL